MCRRPLLAALFALAAPRSGLDAQAPLVRTALDSGAVVRLQLFTGERIVARLVAPFGPDSTTFRYCRYHAPPCGGRLDLRPALSTPAADVGEVDARVGTHAGRGALIGGAVAFGLGLFTYELAKGLCECRRVDPSPYIVVGPALWAGIGALIGSGSPVWGPAP